MKILIKLSLAAGFNGARLHQKVFEERFLYHADRLGYLVWGEFSDWGLNGRAPVREWQVQPDGKVVRVPLVPAGLPSPAPVACRCWTACPATGRRSSISPNCCSRAVINR